MDEKEIIMNKSFGEERVDIDRDFEVENCKEAKTVKVLTQNMFLRPVVKTNESDYKYERLQDLLQVIQNFDILCFQEVFSGLNSHKPQLLTVGKKAGFNYYCHSSKPGYFEKYLTDGGLVNLSRYPIVESDEEVYKKAIGDCSIAKKGVLFSKIDINGNHLYLFNTHLQANYYSSYDLYRKCINTKMYQLKQLAEYIESKTRDMKPDDKIMLVGDFNISSRKFNSHTIAQFKGYAEQDPGYNIFFEEGFNTLMEAEIMKKILSEDGLFSVKDLKERLGDEEGAPATFAGTIELEDGSKAPADTALMSQKDLMTEQSLDYIFILERNDICFKSQEDSKDMTYPITNIIKDEWLLPKQKPFTVKEDTIRVEKFLIKDKKYGALSDHFGLSVNMTAL
ncbi:unnamed protein product [Moneuplotes crassus]|uniref:sphingomyelin phosphodiesterase n=1 Tax=Euplotes crassus TaxID=5936 RepID=A0AAD1UJG4_EUPCR|nr:unnamed protein product [Moneuplotes crassus]